MSDVSVIGGGAWGTALGHMVARHHGETTIWARSAETVSNINECHSNSAYLGNLALDENLVATTSLADACSASTILCVTPAQTIGDMVEAMKPHVQHEPTLVLCAKGIDRETGKLMHDLVVGSGIRAKVAVLSGPSFAHDVARDMPTAVTLAAADKGQAEMLAKQIGSPVFRVYASDDMTGVELGGALKNVLALAVGATRGLGLGASAEAALIARGFAEMTRLAVAAGARPETLTGLSGLGDLVLTCSSPQSRNFAYGVSLASGDDLSSMKLAEGVYTADVALRLAREHDIDVPIIEAVTGVLNGDIVAREAVVQLLARPFRGET